MGSIIIGSLIILGEVIADAAVTAWEALFAVEAEGIEISVSEAAVATGLLTDVLGVEGTDFTILNEYAGFEESAAEAEEVGAGEDVSTAEDEGGADEEEEDAKEEDDGKDRYRPKYKIDEYWGAWQKFMYWPLKIMEVKMALSMLSMICGLYGFQGGSSKKSEKDDPICQWPYKIEQFTRWVDRRWQNLGPWAYWTDRVWSGVLQATFLVDPFMGEGVLQHLLQSSGMLAAPELMSTDKLSVIRPFIKPQSLKRPDIWLTAPPTFQQGTNFLQNVSLMGDLLIAVPGEKPKPLTTMPNPDDSILFQSRTDIVQLMSPSKTGFTWLIDPKTTVTKTMVSNIDTEQSYTDMLVPLVGDTGMDIYITQSSQLHAWFKWNPKPFDKLGRVNISCSVVVPLSVGDNVAHIRFLAYASIKNSVF